MGGRDPVGPGQLNMLDASNVREIFDYDPVYGVLTWKTRVSTKVKVGAVAGAVRAGRRSVGVHGKRYLVSRVVWLWNHLKWPDGDIDHKDRDQLNNRIENLRDVDHHTNTLNRTSTRNPLGFEGVFRAANSDKYVAKITVNGKCHHIGCFDTPEKAHEAFVNRHLAEHGVESKFHPNHVYNSEEENMFGLFKKKAGEVKVELKKVENRDLMEAIVGAMILIAYADGECEKSELEKIERLIRANENLAHFGSEITQVMGRFVEYMEAGPRLGTIKIMREVGDIKSNPRDAEEVFVLTITIAEADGEIEPAEMKVLANLGRELGLRVQDYGVEA